MQILITLLHPAAGMEEGCGGGGWGGVRTGRWKKGDEEARRAARSIKEEEEERR